MNLRFYADRMASRKQEEQEMGLCNLSIGVINHPKEKKATEVAQETKTALEVAYTSDYFTLSCDWLGIGTDSNGAFPVGRCSAVEV